MPTQEEAVLQEAPVAQERPVKTRGRVRGRVRVFQNWCKGCGLCLAFCPQQVFSEDEEHHPVVAHPERCVACQWCTIHCPDFAIVVEIVDATENGAAK